MSLIILPPTIDTLVTSSAVPADSNNHVHLPNVNKVAVTHVGNTCLLANQTISNVLNLPLFMVNLILVFKLTKELNCMVAFFPDFYVFQDLSTGQVKRIGKEYHELYILKGGPTQAPKRLIHRTRRFSN